MEANSKVSDVFKEYKLRRWAIVDALTTESDKLYQMCDPEKDNLCLYGHSNGTWEVKVPYDQGPLVLPEPAMGINFARGEIVGKKLLEWLLLIAIHSSSWLFAITLFSAHNKNFDKNERERLFDLINELPTLFEVVRKEFTTTNPESLDEQDANCAACGIDYDNEEFWIWCDMCGKWYHGKCVSVTPKAAETIKKYMCPTCKRSKDEASLRAEV